MIFHIKDDNLRAEVDELVSIYLSLDNAGRTLVLAKAIEESKKAIQDKINDIDGQINRIIDLYQIGTIPAENIKSRMDALQKEKSRLLSQVEKIGHDKKTPKPDTIKLLNKADYVFKNCQLEEQRALVRAFIKNIEIDGNRLEFHWRI